MFALFSPLTSVLAFHRTLCTIVVCLFAMNAPTIFATETAESKSIVADEVEEVTDESIEETIELTPEEKAELERITKETETFNQSIRKTLKKYCVECHNADENQGGLDLDRYEEYAEAKLDEFVWASVLGRVQSNEMPPEGSPEIDFNGRQELIRWARRHQPQGVDCSKLASDRTVNFYKGSVMSRRLNRAEYHNTIQDLFSIDLDVAQRLPADAAGGGGFDTTGDTLFTSTLSAEKFLDTAEWVLASILPDDPSQQSPNLANARTQLLALGNESKEPTESEQRDRETDIVSEKVVTQEEVRARMILENIARRAFRRTIEPNEIDRYLQLFQRAYERGDGFDASLRFALTGILISPHFLFLVEPEPDEGDIQPLGPFPLASRLSYFLWSTMPDEELLASAESGRLMDRDEYLAQVRRMIQHPKTKALGERFVSQWLEIDKLGADIRPDQTRFPEFDDALAESMRREVIEYFNHVVRNDRSLLELIDSDYSLWDDRLSELYSLQVIENDRSLLDSSDSSNKPETAQNAISNENPFRLVRFENPERGGIIGMAAIHTLTSFPLRTSPVLRGRYVLEILLGEHIPPPPPDVPPLEEDEHAITASSLREQLEQHRKDPTCAACHQRMDPLGFSMEAFDNLGRLRVSTEEAPLDLTAQLPNGFEFEGPTGLKQVLKDRKDQIMRQLTRKLVGYALGRELNQFDDCVIEDGMKALQENEYHPSSLLEVIATSLPFTHRYYAKGVSN